MARTTKNELVLALTYLKAADVVYKAQVDEHRYAVGRIFDEEKRKVQEAFTFGGKWQELSEKERAIELPYTLAHFFGKAFNKALTAAGDTAYTRAIKAAQAEMLPIHEMMTALIARQVKGRAKKETPADAKTRVQLRGICSHCLREHAVTPRGIAAHGYDLQYGFQNGTCSGANKPHFHTPEGRDITTEYRDWLLSHAEATKTRAAEVLAGGPVHPPRDRAGNEKPITDSWRRQVSMELEGQARGMEYHAKALTNALAQWKEQPPTEVKVLA